MSRSTMTRNCSCVGIKIEERIANLFLNRIMHSNTTRFRFKDAHQEEAVLNVRFPPFKISKTEQFFHFSPVRGGRNVAFHDG